MTHNVKKYAVLLLSLCFALSICGCMGRVIAEDEQLDLPEIDPEDGAIKELDVALYYRLANEEYLVEVNDSVSVRPGESTEAAGIRALTEGSPVPPGFTAPIPSNASVQSIVYKDDVLYVTLSDGFLNEDIITTIREEDYLKEKDYNAAVKAATKEMYLMRRLGVYSIVNTIAGSSEDIKVQVLLETKEGQETQIALEQLGIDDIEGALLGPVGFEESVIATEDRIAACLFEHMIDGEYDMAHMLVAESRDAAKPSAEEFETAMSSLGTVVSYEITDMGSDDNGRYVLANVRIASPTGTVKRISNAVLYMEKESDIYKVGYGSLKKLMES